MGKRPENFLTGTCTQASIRYGETSSLCSEFCSSLPEGFERGAWKTPSSGQTPNCIKLLRWQLVVVYIWNDHMYMTRSPARLCSRDGKLCYYGRLEYDFLAFVPCFLLFLFYASFSRYVYLRVFLRLCSSLSKYVGRVHSSCVTCILPDRNSFFSLFSILS